MNRNQAIALVMYMQRAHPIIPTTGAEYASLQGALSLIEAVANGLVTIEVKPIEASPPAGEEPAGEAETAAEEIVDPQAASAA